MDLANPIYIPRNHIVEAALTSASWGDMAPFDELLDAVTRPFEQRAGLDRYAEAPSSESSSGYRTFCGT